MNIPRLLSLTLVSTVCLLTGPLVHAGSATWNVNAVSSDWENPANWTPNTVPNGPGDVATFGPSNVTAISLSSFIELQSLVINPGASVYTFNVHAWSLLTFTGAGIVNNSGLVQNFTGEDAGDGPGAYQFNGSSTAGTDTSFTNSWVTNFDENGSAGEATINCTGGSSYFYTNSTAANATIIANGTSSSKVGAGLVSLGSGTAANATLIATDGTIAGGSIAIGFIGTPGPNTARVKLHGAGYLIVDSGSVGSLEGDGLVLLEPEADLHVGANNLSTTFSGRIKGDRPFAGPQSERDWNRVLRVAALDHATSRSGAITKEGTGTLELSGESSYSLGTTVTDGVLLVSNASGSATGKGAVNVNAGTLGGSGIISGAVTVGTGSGGGAFLAPALGTNKQVTLTLQSSLTLQVDATYTYTFKARKNQARTDLVVANGVTINGAILALQGKVQGTVRTGLVLTVISNTSANPIVGTFSNLAEGAIVNIGSNNFQATYHGGDGNDLTLTVVP